MRNLKIDQQSGSLNFSWKAPLASGIFLLFFGLVWAAGMSIALLVSQAWMIFVPLLIGLFVFYTGLTFLINRKQLTVNHREVSFNQGPLPFFGNASVKVSEVRQFFVIQSGQEKTNNKTTPLYALKALKKDDSQVTIVGNLRGKDDAMKLEHRIEQYLNIRDEAVVVPEPALITKLRKSFPGVEVPPLPGPINDGKPTATGSISPATSSANYPTSSTAPRLLTGYPEQDVFAARIGQELLFIGQPHLVIGQVQYDWSDGRSDVALRIRNGDQVSHVYAEQVSGTKYVYFEERPLDQEEFQQLGIPLTGTPPRIIRNGDDKYYLRNEVSGFRHHDHEATTDAVQQWIYFTTISHNCFRIVIPNNGPTRVYIQEAISPDNLELEKLKVKIERRKK